MERMFSKPFVAALEGHADAVEVLARRPNSITDVASASWDGGAVAVKAEFDRGD
jgi:DDB1- and CUL4-associated factor 13